MIWGCSSAGRAPALQAGGQEFDSPHLHHSDFFEEKVRDVYAKPRANDFRRKRKRVRERSIYLAVANSHSFQRLSVFFSHLRTTVRGM